MQILIPVLIVAAIGLIAGVGLALASRFMAVPVDEKCEKLRGVLPGANCGACGHTGCDGYAKAVAEGEDSPNKCTVGGDAVAAALAEILGVEVKTEKRVAYIACNGDCVSTKRRYDYEGIDSCSAASLLYGGPLECAFGCIGMGDCSKACKFGAITMSDSKPIICEDLCVGCGLCASVCPKKVISLVPKEHKVLVGCSNTERGAAVAAACKKSCIACSLCVKQCENGAIRIENNLPVIDYEKCTGCQRCKNACKRGVLV